MVMSGICIHIDVCVLMFASAMVEQVEMLLLKELHHDNIVSLQGAGFLPDGRRFVALVSLFKCR